MSDMTDTELFEIINEYREELKFVTDKRIILHTRKKNKDEYTSIEVYTAPADADLREILATEKGKYRLLWCDIGRNIILRTPNYPGIVIPRNCPDKLRKYLEDMSKTHLKMLHDDV